MLTKPVFFDIGDFSHSSGGAQRIFFMGVVSNRPVLERIIAIMSHNSGKRYQPTAQGFTQHKDIRCNKIFTGKHFAGAPKAFDNFIKN